MILRLGLVAAFSFLAALPTYAQEGPALRAGHFTVQAGVTWSGPYDVGDATAQLRGNAGGASAPFTLFDADSRVSMAFAPECHVGFALTRHFAIDGGIAFSRPRIGVAITGDAEAPSQQLDGERLDQYQIDGRLTWQLPVRTARQSILRRVAPFAAIGGGYLRQLHEDRALAESGWIYFAGGGARYWLRGGSGSSRDLGVRADARINVRTGGIDFENKMRIYPAVTLTLFIGL